METKLRSFGKRDRVGYFLGDFGNALLFGLASNYLTLFYVDILGIAAASVGTLLLVARAWDAINDPIIGTWIDTRKPTKVGQFRPWFLRMAIPVAGFGVLSFFCVPALGAAPVSVKLLYAYVTYIGFGMSYTAINIPYGALVSVMTDVPTERASLSMARAYGSTMAVLMVNILVPIFVFNKDNIPQASGFIKIVLILAILSLISWVLCYKMTEERIRRPNTAHQKIDFKATFVGVTKNKAFIALVLSGFLSLMQFLIIFTLTPYLFKDYFRDTQVLPWVALVSMLPIFLISPILNPLVSKFGKKEISVIGCIFASFFGFLIYFLPSINTWTYLILLFFCTAGYTFINLLTWALVADTIDYHEYITHRREEGVIYAIYSFSRKMGQAGAGFLGAWVLIWVGYVAKAPVQSVETANKIKEFAGLIPGILNLAVAIVMFFLYDLNREKLDGIIEELRERRKSLRNHS